MSGSLHKNRPYGGDQELGGQLRPDDGPCTICGHAREDHGSKLLPDWPLWCCHGYCGCYEYNTWRVQCDHCGFYEECDECWNGGVPQIELQDGA